MNRPYLRTTRFLLLIGIMLLLPACAAANPAGSAPVNDSDVEPAATTQPETITPSPTLVATPTWIPSPTPIPFTTPTNLPPTPGPSALESFVASLETALRDRDAAALSAVMSDPFAIGAWRSEWFSLSSQEAAREIIEHHTPDSAEPLFSEISQETIDRLLDGQDPQQMMGPDVNVAAVLHGQGWSADGDEEVVLFIVENADDAYAWHAFLYAPQYTDTAAPEPAYPALDTLVFTDTESISPDGTWTATIQQSELVTLADGSQAFYNALTVTDGTTTWGPAGGWRGYGLGVSYLNIYRWGADGQTLYYGNTTTPDGCGLFTDQTDLSRLHLETGAVAELLPAYSAWNLSLSPDESILAAVTWDGQQLGLDLLNLEAGVQDRIPLTGPGENAQAGNLTWSPDGKRFLLTVAHDPCLPAWTHSILLVDPAELTIQPLIDRDPRLFNVSEWPTDNKAILHDEEGNLWDLNLTSREISPQN